MLESFEQESPSDEGRMAQETQAESEAFPSLTDGQIARIVPFTTERDLRDGESLWEAGDRNRPLFVVVKGEIEILSGADHVVTVHRPGAFTGDVDLLSGRPVVVRARALGPTRVLELPATRLRSMVQTDAELSEIFLRAFMMRRVLLMADRLRAGTVWVNTYRAVSYLSPFGGYKRSGIGRESGLTAIREYLQEKSVWIDTIGEVANPFVQR